MQIVNLEWSSLQPIKLDRTNTCHTITSTNKRANAFGWLFTVVQEIKLYSLSTRHIRRLHFQLAAKNKDEVAQIALASFTHAYTLHDVIFNKCHVRMNVTSNEEITPRFVFRTDRFQLRRVRKRFTTNDKITSQLKQEKINPVMKPGHGVVSWNFFMNIQLLY